MSHSKDVPKLGGDSFCIPTIFKNPIKAGFSIRNMLFSISVLYFLFVKGLLHDYQILVYKKTFLRSNYYSINDSYLFSARIVKKIPKICTMMKFW